MLGVCSAQTTHAHRAGRLVEVRGGVLPPVLVDGALSKSSPSFRWCFCLSVVVSVLLVRPVLSAAARLCLVPGIMWGPSSSCEAPRELLRLGAPTLYAIVRLRITSSPLVLSHQVWDGGGTMSLLIEVAPSPRCGPPGPADRLDKSE